MSSPHPLWRVGNPGCRGAPLCARQLTPTFASADERTAVRPYVVPTLFGVQSRYAQESRGCYP
jgi:hypothetical protein